MTFEAMPKPPKRRAADVTDSDAPGLAEHETALLLGRERVAVSVSEQWAPNGAGLVLAARARLIERDGATATDPRGRPIKTEIRHSADLPQFARLGLEALRREMLLAVLGEPPTLADDGAGETVPILPLAEEVRLNCSIRAQAALVRAIARPADPAALLGV